MIRNSVLVDLMGICLFILLLLGLCCHMANYACHKKAEALGYKCSWHFGSGCVLEKPNGKKVLLEQLREFE